MQWNPWRDQGPLPHLSTLRFPSLVYPPSAGHHPCTGWIHRGKRLCKSHDSYHWILWLRLSQQRAMGRRLCPKWHKTWGGRCHDPQALCTYFGKNCDGRTRCILQRPSGRGYNRCIKGDQWVHDHGRFGKLQNSVKVAGGYQLQRLSPLQLRCTCFRGSSFECYQGSWGIWRLWTTYRSKHPQIGWSHKVWIRKKSESGRSGLCGWYYPLRSRNA